MKCRIKHLAVYLLFVTATPVYSLDDPYDLDRLKNNKEAISTAIAKNEWTEIEENVSSKDRRLIPWLFKYSLQNLVKTKPIKELCDLTIIDYFTRVLKNVKYSVSEDEVKQYLKILRVEQAIDDIFYEILVDLNRNRFGLLRAKNDFSKPSPSYGPEEIWEFEPYDRYENEYEISDEELFKSVDLSVVYHDFKFWPDGQDRCIFSSVTNIGPKIIASLEKGQKLNSETFERYNYRAYSTGVIDLATYKKLEYLREDSTYFKRKLGLYKYLDIVYKAKDLMVSQKYKEEISDITLEDTYTSEQIERLSTLSRRKLVYEKYNSQQILMLAQVIEKASQRMGNDPDVESSAPVIMQQFTRIVEGKKVNYVERYELDSQSQYNYARRRMRVEINDLQNMTSFQGISIDYADLVTAALETGYITHEDIASVVMYDDLWNPEIPPYSRLKRFAYTVGRTTLLYLPPPWNITASIGLTAVESLLSSNKSNGVYNDNPATIFE